MEQPQVSFASSYPLALFFLVSFELLLLPAGALSVAFSIVAGCCLIYSGVSGSFYLFSKPEFFSGGNYFSLRGSVTPA
jgi:hypothetical protein